MADLKKMMDKAEEVMKKTDIDEKLIDAAAKELKKKTKIDDKIIDTVAKKVDDLDKK